MFIVLGSCSRPDYDCTFLQEVRVAIAALRRISRAAARPRPIAVVADGGIAPATLMRQLEPDAVYIIPPKAFAEASTKIAQGDDLRVRKLVAYLHAPYERTVFFDGDTHARDAKIEMLFESLQGGFDLSAAFECCRKDWGNSNAPYDAGGYMRGWEMQTGVMAFRPKSPRIDAFWREAIREYQMCAAATQPPSTQLVRRDLLPRCPPYPRCSAGC
jgi:hypothetical protein